MKFIRSKIQPRIANADYNYKNIGISPYDADNGYPQRITNIVNATGTGKYCIQLFSKFIEGNGFKDQTFYKSIVNSKGLTLDKLLRKVAKDYANRNGFAIHVNYNGLFQIVDMRPVQFADCRLGHCETEYKGKIAVYDDWYKLKRRTFKKEDIHFYDQFNPDPNVIAMQIEKAGGITNWKGQIYWYSTEGNDYPLAPYDAVLEDMETDGRIKNYKRKKAATGWNADFAIVFKGKFEKDNERQETREGLEEYQGDEAGGSIPMIEVEKEEEVPSLLSFPKISDKEDFYSANETSVQNNIRKVFGFPPPLIGDFTSGKLGMSQEIIEATAYMNGLTGQERRIMEETFQMLFKSWHDPAINPSKDYSILPLSIIAQPEAPAPTQPTA